MKPFKNLPAIGFAILLAACAFGWYWTRDTDEGRGAAKATAAANQSLLIDQRLIQTADQMAAQADTKEEQDLAREALRLTDHELDQSFATALREAVMRSGPASGPLQQLSARIAQLKTRVAASQQRITQLTKDAATKDTAADQLELAKAQLALDQDELDDAQQELELKGGDEHSKLERALQEHEAAQHQVAVPLGAIKAAPTATLSEQVRLWLSLTERDRQVLAARQQADRKAANLATEHDSLAKGLTGAAAPASAAAADQDTEDTAAVVAQLRQLSDQRKTLAELNRRMQDVQQLGGVYQRWNALLAGRKRDALHVMLRTLAAIFAILFAVVLLDQAIRHAFRRQKVDRRRLHQLRIMVIIAVQFVGAAVILLIVFGAPTQMTTIIGLATAGLTVVMKDFIVAFFGWFVLMGKNGIHMGDWVEIEGVGGEVIEIGLLKTVLLEMGNWTNTGHPTGRHVAFVNSFAIEGHYFNFSTAGQWLWDELQVMLPSTSDSYQMAEQVRVAVEQETEADARQAELDWERVTHQYGTRTFSAKPTVDLKPSVNRLDVNVRYITRAPERYEVKSRLFQKIVDLLHQPAASGKPA
ncbi:MscS Mechanosensitive ion channel [Candidatus Sulfopaludibacter sp. SbA4]|nr:MscS Mechanosensitive ion channel [Candidatus Sulfopaludibacter sp. SbA4]